VRARKGGEVKRINTHTHTHEREREHTSTCVYLKERGSLDTLNFGDVVRGVVCALGQKMGFGGFILILGMIGGDDDH
jgi:hypothetical protein